MTEETKEEMDEKTYSDNEDFEEDEFIESPFKRVFIVLFSPRLVYESLSVKSSKLDWIIPLVLSLLFALIIINSGYDFLRNDQHEVAIKRIENNTKLTEEQKADVIHRAQYVLNSVQVRQLSDIIDLIDTILIDKQKPYFNQ